ncbi:hypothetical protein ACI79D_20185 [Geodermatophilus sp. SYSU D00708]
MAKTSPKAASRSSAASKSRSLIAAVVVLLTAVGVLIAAQMLLERRPDTWREAWNSGSIVTLEDWFREHSGPTVALNSTPLTGEQVVDSQVAADALVGRIVHGTIRITVDNVTLRDFLLRGDGSRELVRIVGDRHNISIVDAEIDGQGEKNSIGIGGDSYARAVTVERVEIHRVGFDAIRLMVDSTYRHVYVHNLWRWDEAKAGRPYNGDNSQETDPHTDAMQMVRGGGLVEQCWLDNYGVGADNATSAVFISPGADSIDGWTIRQSYLNGGGYTIHVHPGPHGTPERITIEHNRFGRGHRLGIYSDGDVPAGNISKTGNVWADSLEPVPA